MIQANELRIGNIFWESYGGYKIVKAINCNKIGDMPNTVSAHAIGMDVCGQFDCSEINGIPLSEEILFKVGFEKSTGEDQRISYIDEIFWIPGMYFLEFDGVWHFYHLTDEDTYWEIKYDVKHLHQLQNLYFALTGEELDVSKLI